MEFVKKSAEEISKMSAEEMAGYYNDMNAAKTAEIEKSIEAKASKEDIENLKNELKDAQINQLKSLNEALKEQGVVLKKLTQKEVVEKKESLLDILSAKSEDLTKLRNSNSSSDNVKFEVKAVGDMSIAGNVTGAIPQAMRLSGVNDTPSRRVRLLDIVSTGAISSNLVEWVYKANEEGAAGQTAEGATKNQIDFDLLVGSQKVEKTTAYITVTDEMLDDVEQMNTMINAELNRELLKAVETQVYSGSGTSPQMNGILTTATAFSAGTFALSIDNANEIDVLTVAKNQIELAQEGSADVNYILMHPSDVTALKMVKVSSTDKRYVERLAMIGGNLSMDGVSIIPSTLVTQGTYLIGDFTKSFVLQKQGVSIEIGYNADNFVKNYKTVRAEWRGVTFVKNNDRTAFVKGTFATDKAALETV